LICTRKFYKCCASFVKRDDNDGKVLGSDNQFFSRVGVFHLFCNSRPGQDILSAFSDPKDRRKTFVRTGTSMAVPHAVGVIAMYLQWNPKLTHAQILDYIRRDGTPNSIFGLINSANVLLNSTAIRRRIALPPAATPIAINVPAPAPTGDGTSTRPTLSPIARETGPTPPSDNREKCNIIFSKCEEDKDCCLKTCRQFGEVLDRRCFFF
jgi:hypothetical protein